MSLLDTASLIVTPNAYKEGKLYSVIPSDGSGDMSVVRATTATRVNSAGLVELVPYNLLTYSEEINNWGQERASVITNATTAPNGTLTADKLITDSTPNTTHQAYNGAFTANVGTLVISGYFKKGEYNLVHLGTSASAQKAWFDLDTGVVGNYNAEILSASIENVGDGWYRCVAVVNNSSASIYVEFGPANVDGSRTILGTPSGGIFAWGIQYNEGSAALPYQKTETRLNIPRLDYSNGTCPSLLVEPQRTNLVVQSNNMTTWAYGAGTMTQNATISPDGTNNALSFDNTSDCSTFVATSNGVYSWSLYVKQGTSPTASIDMSDGATGDVLTTFTFATKTFSGTTAGGSWTSPSASYIEYENGWFRITLTATKNAGSFIGHKINTSGSGYTYVYGAQLELGSYPTSYIPTTSASVTRNADVISKTGISSLIGQTEGTVFLDFIAPDGTAPILINLATSNQTYLESIYLEYDPANSGLSSRIWTNGSLVGGVTANGIIKGNRYKVALAYKANDTSIYVDGSAITGMIQPNAIQANLSQLYLGNLAGLTGNATFTGLIGNSAALWKTRLTNTQLAALTTI